ncbi:hypothetical protein ACIPZC_11110 [Pseudomonas sp. NPDC089743]|uniref:hypothetical protein n=1 Tax=Pseudomonas sp. NPDC089743 TaxID=3364471 RepID=UPI00380F8FA4
MRIIQKWLRARWPGLFGANRLGPPTAPMALPDVPDGEPGLLPLSILDKPVRIEVPMWPISNPTPATPEALRLYWNGVQVDEKRWEAAIPEDDLFVEAPVSVLQHGPVEVSYEVQSFNGVVTSSRSLTLTIDKVSPVLGGDEGLLLFDEEVRREGVTARYLERHGNILLAELPAYERPSIGDVINYYWDDQPFANDWMGELTVEALDQTIYLPIDGDAIKERGDGPRYVHYQIRDRAGNLSARSRPAVLEVAAEPIPRHLPWLSVSQASGSGGELSLELDKYTAPLAVVVSADAVIYPGEVVTVQWGAPGDYGYYTTSEPEVGTDGRFLIPERSVLAYSKRTLEVGYVVSDGTEHFPGTPCNLKVTEFKEGLPQVALEGADSDGFSLGSAPELVPVSLGVWPGIAVGQRVNITVTGVLPSGAEAPPYDILTAHSVNDAQVRRGIGANKDVTLPKAYLARLMRDHPFTFNVEVSFDDGTTWVKFPLYRPVLRR